METKRDSLSGGRGAENGRWDTWQVVQLPARVLNGMLTAILPLGVCALLLFFLIPAGPGKTLDLHTLASAPPPDSRCFVHIKAKARMAGETGFEQLHTSVPLQDLEVWRGEDTSLVWCAEKAGCLMISDGTKGGLFTSSKSIEGRATSRWATAFPDYGFIGPFLWGATLLAVEENDARNDGAIVATRHWTARSGAEKVTISITPANGQSSATTVDSWLHDALCKEYVFDSESQRVEKVRVYCKNQCGQDVDLFETASIDYVSISTAVEAFAEKIAVLDAAKAGDSGLTVAHVAAKVGS